MSFNTIEYCKITLDYSKSYGLFYAPMSPNERKKARIFFAAVAGVFATGGLVASCLLLTQDKPQEAIGAALLVPVGIVSANIARRTKTLDTFTP
jgi:predicted tellurium resistance membrane protein TerC